MAIGRTQVISNPNLFLYDNGNEFQGVTGTFAEVQTTTAGVTAVFTKNVDSLEIEHTHTTTTGTQRSYFQTTNAIDLTDYRALLVDVQRAGTADTFDIYMAVDTDSGVTLFDERYLLTASTSPTFNVIDITAITGSNYIYAGMNTVDDDDDVATVEFFKIYLVK